MLCQRKQRTYPLSPDGVAAITVLGDGKCGQKSINLHEKREILDRCGFLFPRRNLVVTSDVLLETLLDIGLDKGWDGKKLSLKETKMVYPRFEEWAIKEIWPIALKLFEHRAIYIRSDAPWDSLGRGVYDSIPFANEYGGTSDENARAKSFCWGFFNVVMSYFHETAGHVTKKLGVTEQGINVFFSQFIGRAGEFLLRGAQKTALAPFLSAVVKTAIVSGKCESLIRFEYGLGSGAIVGRTIIVKEDGVITLSKKVKLPGVQPILSQASPEVIVLPETNVIMVDDSNWPVVQILMRSAYPEISGGIENEAQRKLEWLVENIKRFEQLNENVPLYLELVSSSFRDQMHWFVVQAADFEPVNPLPRPPKELTLHQTRIFQDTE